MRTSQLKSPRFFGKSWTLEWKGESAFITDAQSAATVEVRASEKNMTSIWCSNLKLYANVPLYIRDIVDRHLFRTK
jgi:hypothetical protein